MENHIIMFDLDGTLIDSVPDICGALNRTLARIGRREHSAEEVAGYLGSGSVLFMKKALQATGVVPDGQTIETLAAEFLEEYAANPVRETVVYPGVFEALDELKNRGAILALCTNKPGAMVAPVLKTLGLDGYFRVVVCGDDVTNRKPHGDHIRETVRAAGGLPETSAIMVGDNINDFLAARDAGISSIAVTFGYAQCSPDALGADAMVDDFRGLVASIENVLMR